MKSFLGMFLLLPLAACVRQAASDSGTANSMATAGVAASPPSSAAAWHPQPGATFQLQFSGELDLSIIADVYDLDLFDTPDSIVRRLHAQGRKAVCYVSVGSWEDWRPDADQFPAELIGRDYTGWPGEKWLDIRRIDLLAPILRARLDLCAAKGFDGVEPDNLQVVDNDTGFPISYQDELDYALWLADEAHARGLAIGLKNAPELAADALGAFDFAVTEDCYDDGWCDQLASFLQAGKPVFAIEYTDTDVDFEAACRQARSLGMTMLLKNRDLDAFLFSCP
jgi:hypothetical protein